MKHLNQIDDQARFKGHFRHYHRPRLRSRSWHAWAKGEDAKPNIWNKCLKIACNIVALLALGAIVAGLVIAL